MIKLSNGVEISEDTVVSALKKAGINVEPKHIFETGDVAYCEGKIDSDNWRLIVEIHRILYSVDNAGNYIIQGQAAFETYNYKYIGKLKDLLKS